MRILIVTSATALALMSLAVGGHAHIASSVGQKLPGRQASDSVSVLRVIQSFMTAARTDDSVAISQRSRGDQPKRWVEQWRHASEFFDQTRVLKEMDFESPRRSKALVSFSVTYRTFAGLCGRHAPEDELNFELSKKQSQWAIDRIWSPIC